jgi:hypothetical protein
MSPVTAVSPAEDAGEKAIEEEKKSVEESGGKKMKEAGTVKEDTKKDKKDKKRKAEQEVSVISYNAYVRTLMSNRWGSLQMDQRRRSRRRRQKRRT